MFNVGGPNPTDVQQGRYATCGILAAGQVLAKHDPVRLSKLFETRADLMDIALQPRPKRVFRLGAQSSSPGTPLWPYYLEKAFAKARGGRKELLRRQDPSKALTWLTGEPAETLIFSCNLTPHQRIELIAIKHRVGALIVVHTKDHAYALIDVIDSALTLMDPRDGPRREHRITADIPAAGRIHAFSYTLAAGNIAASRLTFSEAL